jgi:hypothetical protein
MSETTGKYTLANQEIAIKNVYDRLITNRIQEFNNMINSLQEKYEAKAD